MGVKKIRFHTEVDTTWGGTDGSAYCTSSYVDARNQIERGLLNKIQFLLNLYTGRSLTESTIPDAVLIQFDLLMMSTELLETCGGL